MTKQILKLHTKLNKYSFYQKVCLFARTLVRVIQMIAPAAVGGYLVFTYDDKVVVYIGVALALYSLLRIVNSAYLAEARGTSKRK